MNNECYNDILVDYIATLNDKVYLQCIMLECLYTIKHQIKSNILLDKAKIAYMRNPLYNTDMANSINNTI